MSFSEKMARLHLGLTASVIFFGGTRQKSGLDFPLPIHLKEAGSAKLDADGATWECRYIALEVSDRPDAIDLYITVKLEKGTAASAGAAVSIDFENWSRENYVLLPGAVYNSNRFRSLAQPYPPLLSDPQHHKADLPTTVADIPRLSVNDVPSKIEQTTGDPATPAVGVYFPTLEYAFWLLTEQQTKFGNSGFTIEENDDRSRATLTVTAPCMRGERQAMCNKMPSEDHAPDWEADDEVTIYLRLYTFAAPELQTLFDRFTGIRKDLTPKPKLPNMVPFSSAWSILEEKYNRDNWNEEWGYYAVGATDDLCAKWQLGWVGGGIATLPLLLAGRPKSRERARRNIAMILERTQAPSGFLYGIGDGEHFYGDGFLEPHPHNMHMTRKSADALYFLGKQFLLLDALGYHVRPEWKKAYQRLSDAFVKLWENHSQFGQFVDVETGDLLVGGTTSASAAPAGLALASVLLNNPRYMEIAEASAKLFYERDVIAGVTNGGPGEILQAPDSESAFGLLESFVALYELTGKIEWLKAASEMARQCATWCVSYDYAFPDNSLFNQLDMHTTGSVYANAQNKHAAPGICTLSGDSLLKLFRATGEVFYLELLREIAHNLPQYLSRENRIVGEMPSGWINERVNMSDWEGPQKVGSIFNGSCWPEVSLMLTYVEVPGLYVQTDTGIVCAIDHIEAEIVQSSDKHVIVKLHNPTTFPAEVRVLAESSEQAKKPLGVSAMLQWPIISLASGATQEIRLEV